MLDATNIDRPQRLPPALAHHEILALLKLATWAQARIDAALEPYEMKTRHYTSLSVLRDKEHWSQLAVAQKLRIDKATMVAVINDLDGRGLVHRERDRNDKRHYRISITGRGEALLAELDATVAQVEDEVFAPLAGPQRAELLRLMTALFAGGAG